MKNKIITLLDLFDYTIMCMNFSSLPSLKTFSTKFHKNISKTKKPLDFKIIF